MPIRFNPQLNSIDLFDLPTLYSDNKIKINNEQNHVFSSEKNCIFNKSEEECSKLGVTFHWIKFDGNYIKVANLLGVDIEKCYDALFNEKLGPIEKTDDNNVTFPESRAKEVKLREPNGIQTFSTLKEQENALYLKSLSKEVKNFANNKKEKIQKEQKFALKLKSLSQKITNLTMNLLGHVSHLFNLVKYIYQKFKLFRFSVITNKFTLIVFIYKQVVFNGKKRTLSKKIENIKGLANITQPGEILWYRFNQQMKPKKLTIARKDFLNKDYHSS